MTVVSAIALATVGVPFTVTTRVSSTKSVPPSVARITSVALPVRSAPKLRSRALSASIVAMTSVALLLLAIVKARPKLPSSTSANTAFRSR